MKIRILITCLLTLLLALGASPATTQASRLQISMENTIYTPSAPLGTAITYQGYLTDGGSPANGAFDFEFKLYDALTAGAQVGGTVAMGDVAVSDGTFTVTLDFGLASGGSPFDGTALFLEIGVREGSSSGAFTTLAPRQALTAAPYALYAANAAKATNAANADALGGQPASAYQTPAQFTRTSLDYDGTVGSHTSTTIGNDRLGLVAYNDTSNEDLKVAHCHDTACTSADITTLDSSEEVGKYTSITIGGDGLGLISYRREGANPALKVAHCKDTACTSADITTVDSDGITGQLTSITTGADGFGLISYYNFSRKSLMVAHCTNATCTSADITELDDYATGTVGQYTSITTGGDDLGLISYYDSDSGKLKVAHCGNTACSVANFENPDGTSNDVGLATSITTGADGFGLISYYDITNGRIKVAHCGDAHCTSTNATITVLDTVGPANWFTSITTGGDDLGLISYYDDISDTLKVIHCHDADCTSFSRQIIDDSVDAGKHTSIATGYDGLGLISYYDDSNKDLVVAHCDDALCKP